MKCLTGSGIAIPNSEEKRKIMRKFLGLMPVLALIAYAPGASAALDIYYSINGLPAVLCGSDPISAGPVSCSIASATVNALVVTGTSNSPGLINGADQLADTVEVTSTANATLQIWVTAQDFTEPTAPPSLTYESSLSTTSTLQPGLLSTVGLQSCVNTANAIASSTPLSCAASLTNPTESLLGNTSASNTVGSIVGSLTTPYSLQQLITFSLVNGSNVNAVTSQSLTPVPEPASVILLGSLALGIATALRKRGAVRQS